MKVFLAIILCSAMFAVVNSCYPSARIVLSDRRQYICVVDSPLLDIEVYTVEFERQGGTYRCRELLDSDPDHDSSVQYPAAPEVTDNSETIAVATVGATQTAVCVYSRCTLAQQAQLGSKGYFVAADLKINRLYVCLEAKIK